ncbi:sugar O-acyltransferase (sialic acid O-acetyltransferase NeuD family) [Algoriphagus ratkowskyi]|uniref:Acetyltransferase n=1 Tax=Algoriphagus ratkowskyi TaxID=57028 RepID=A0A2W7RA03_9BACT|nr:acetyltransferase [Algoriphagus ratkowskyi]PZX57768.1 sugar O-acyltransferase (sialic acid O-acetyltransferase NeuD family) [Algoriphagus ratkowskyi]TXD79032.1 acetyltransferase [Algoriphagus ratkowskyi]
MIIAGAGGHGKEVRHVLIQQGFSHSEISFFDEDPTRLIDSGILSSEETQAHFSKDSRFVLGVGNPFFREKLYNLLVALGGTLFGLTNHHPVLSEDLAYGFDEMPFSFIGPDTKIGLGVLVNTRAHIHHDCEVGDFSEIGPGAMMLGGSKIGKHCRIGAGVIVLPGVELGDGVIVGAGAVVTKSVFEKSTLVGIPAKTLI